MGHPCQSQVFQLVGLVKIQNDNDNNNNICIIWLELQAPLISTGEDFSHPTCSLHS